MHSRGSIWRRWDLHVHTPASIVQQYGGNVPASWDAFVHALAVLPDDIAVLGINDYLFIDGYEQLLKRRAEIPNISAIFPSIEFRLNTFAGTADSTKRHNFHIIFDPSVSPSTIKEQLLNCLSTGYRLDNNTKWQRTPTVESLTELGALMKKNAPAGNSIHSKTDLQIGFESITYDREEILGNLAKDCFAGRHLVAIGFSEWDQSRWNQAAALKRTLINIADFSLTNNDDVGKIAEHATELRSENLNDLILHSSDAHDLARLGKTKLWIKADPTFAGLKQIINAPDRVFVGDSPPRFKQAHQVIEQLTIPASAGWFTDNFALTLNESLVAIIGGRGSGKSALAEMIARAAGATDESDESFTSKASKHASTIVGTAVHLKWADSTQTQGEVGAAERDPGLVKYLPQKAVEEICSPKNSTELISQIESVIFQSLDPTARMGASDFSQLKDNLLAGYAFEKQEIVAALQTMHRQYQVTDNSIKTRPTKLRDLERRREDLKKLQGDLPKLPEADEKAQNELAVLLSRKKRLEERIVGFKQTQEQIGALQTRIRVFKASFDSFANETLGTARQVGLTDVSPFSFKVDFEAMQTALTQRFADLEAQVRQLTAGTPEEVQSTLGNGVAGPYDNYRALTVAIDERTKQTRAFETQKIKYQQQKTKIADTEKAISALEVEISRITTELTPQRDAIKEARFAKYCEYFRVLESERTEITKLYQPLQDSLNEGSDTDRRLKFNATIAYRIDDHAGRGLTLIDRTKRGNFREAGALSEGLSRFRDACIKGDFKDATVRAALTALWKEFTNLDPAGTPSTIDIEGQLRESVTMEDFFNWFLDPSSFYVTSSLSFDDTNLYLLSPGQKGIVLLMLYLAMDKDDTRPLIIDQPEDNLDNFSVYRDLIDLFRKRKRFRQIILVTHNPNLVVNTDAEQVIVASYDGKSRPRVTYTSGSLENQAELIPNVEVKDLVDGIIEKVCEILEGGPPAFKSRSKVYSSSPKLH